MTEQTVTVWDGRLLRTLADALEQLRVVKKLSADDRIEIRAMPMRLPGRRVTSVVSVCCGQSDRVAFGRHGL